MEQRSVGQQIPLAIALMLTAICCFSLLNASGKYLSAHYAVVQVVWARYVFALVAALDYVPAAARPGAILKPRAPASSCCEARC